MDAFGDLHTHTAHSREADNFLEIRLKDYERARRKMPEFTVVGVVDHDTLNHVEPMYRARGSFSSGQLPILLPGIEITCAFEHPTRKGKSVQTHILGYFPDLISENESNLRRVNSVLEGPLNRSIDGKLRKNVDLRLEYFFKSGLIPPGFTFQELRDKALSKYEADKAYVESREPKKGDIINWTMNSSHLVLTQVLLEEGIVSSIEEGTLYLDRVSEEKAARLAAILAERFGLSAESSLEKAKSLQGICHGNYNDDFYKMSTQEAITLIREAGGIAILAHPMVSLKSFKDGEAEFFDYCLSGLVRTGLQGMEAFYPKQDSLKIVDLCARNNLYVTGGSDDHQDGRNHIGEKGSRCPIGYIKSMLGHHLE